MLRPTEYLMKHGFYGIQTALYRAKHWFFKWTVDDEGDLTLTVAGVMNLTKYKEHTCIRWCKNYKPAGKWQGYEQPVPAK